MRNKVIGIIGCGNIGSVILAQGLKGKAQKFIISEKDRLKEAFICREYHVKASKDIIDLVRKSDIIIIAVKPQDIDVVLEQIHQGIEIWRKREVLIISIVAGIKTGYIESKISGKVKVVRAMPNMPGAIGEGITALTKGYYATNGDIRLAEKIFKSLGVTMEIRKEGLINVVTALSGSGPAYIFFIINAILRLATKSLGLDKMSANKLLYHTVVGAMNLYKEKNFDADKLISQIASKGGTTEAALEVFKKKKLNKILWEGILAAFERAEGLSR